MIPKMLRTVTIYWKNYQSDKEGLISAYRSYLILIESIATNFDPYAISINDMIGPTRFAI